MNLQEEHLNAYKINRHLILIKSPKKYFAKKAENLDLFVLLLPLINHAVPLYSLLVDLDKKNNNMQL